QAPGGAVRRGAATAAPLHAGVAAGRAAVAAGPRGGGQQGLRRLGTDGAGAGRAVPLADRPPGRGPRRRRVPLGGRTQWIVSQLPPTPGPIGAAMTVVGDGNPGQWQSRRMVGGKGPSPDRPGTRRTCPPFRQPRWPPRLRPPPCPPRATGESLPSQVVF